MRKKLLGLSACILLSTLLAATAQQFGDFTYTSDGSAITISGYTGPGGAVTIPDTIIGLPVTTIGGSAFYHKYSITSVTIPDSIISIEAEAFERCFSLTSLTIPGSVTTIGGGAFNVCTGLTNVTILKGVTSIGYGAFNDCRGLTSVTIPGSVNSIGDSAFSFCDHLKGVFFVGNAPDVASNWFLFSTGFICYLPGTTGWGATFGGTPTRLWNPLMESSGVGPAGFGFNITGTADIPIVVEAATSLANAAWVPLQSLNLTNGAFYFSDPNWTTHPARFYRIRSP